MAEPNPHYMDYRITAAVAQAPRIAKNTVREVGVNDMAPRPQLAGLSLFAGTGMLDEGVRAGFDYLGFDYRCVGYVERDAYAAAALVARMEGQAVDQAPVWDDITTFDGLAWRGVG